MPDWLTRDASGSLLLEGMPADAIANTHGTPVYVYSEPEIERTWARFQQAIASREATICYALKANSNLAIVDCFRRLGASFDIVSVGELERVLAVGGEPAKIVFSGVGKSEAEMRRALDVGVGCFNVESIAELERLERVATSMGRRAPISLRVNPEVDAATHPYISTGLRENKFGIEHARARETYARAATMKGLRIVGIDCHIGSQITDTAPFIAAMDRVFSLVDQLREDGIELEHIDLGGGLGIRYRDETPPTPRQYMDAVFAHFDRWRQGRSYRVMFEFGRALVGNAGVLLTRTEFLKNNGERHFAIVDAAMNDLLRPSIYQAWHGIVPVLQRSGPTQRYDIVGPVCESGDWLGKQRDLHIEAGDLLAVLSAGAYGSAMASNYNTRPRAAESMLVRRDGGTIDTAVIRPRETVRQLLAQERLARS